jgi:hypothetical protein
MLSIKNQQTSKLHQLIALQIDSITPKIWIPDPAGRVVYFDYYAAAAGIDIGEIRRCGIGLGQEMHIAKVVKINRACIEFEP